VNEPIKDFKQLRVYQSAFSAAMDIFNHSDTWPKRERFALTDQIRRSSRAVCSAIAEAWFKRRYPRHFISKLSDASSEAAETLVWLDFALDCEYLQSQPAASLQESYRRIIGGLTKMMDQPEKWCIPSSSVEEPLTPYVASSAS
jgi:four helix bundle protein